MWVFPFGAAGVSAAFAAQMARQFAARHRPHQLAWTVALAMFALAATATGLGVLLGWDAAREIRAWHAPEEVLRLARPVVVSRPGYPAPTERDLGSAGIEPTWAILCDVPTPDVESTDVRRLVLNGGSLAGLVDPAVEAYLRRHRLYVAQRSGRK